jgi:hypothetical protein
MNVFEDLIVELKEANLLEKTVNDDVHRDEPEIGYLDETDVPNTTYDMLQIPAEQNLSALEIVDEVEIEVENSDVHLHETVSPDVREAAISQPRKPRNGQEYYRKRAMSEVSNLQMVEHVLTGVERQYMKVVPNVFEDFNAKKALNTFLHITENENSPEHQEAEFNLMQETEAWCTALADRDKHVPVASLRNYCENSSPPLSSQALVALARFYRNLPYTEAVRSKFDFVMTRLFSRPGENELRSCLFNREEMLAHINTLYGEWSSLALYSVNEDESNVVIAALSFEDLAIEAENAGSFDQLIKSDFFGRLRQFKGGISELFYAPSVTVAAIDANVRVGNAYITLIARERQRMDADSIQSKYGAAHDDSVAEGAARTLDLVNLLRSPLNQPTQVENKQEDRPVEKEKEKEKEKEEAPLPLAKPALPTPSKNPSQFVNDILANAFSINRWLLGVSILLVAASLAIYIYSNFFVTERVSTSTARVVTLEDPTVAEFISASRVSGETFHGMLAPPWDALPKERRLEVLQKIYRSGKDKGFTKVNLLTKEGKSVGFASATRLEVTMP